MRLLGTSRKLALLTPVLGLALLSPVPPAVAANVSVVVGNDYFSPSTVTIGLGGTVTWNFRGTHTSTSNQGFWDSGDKNPGQSYVRGFPYAGSFGYHCAIHPMMTGTVRVPIRSFGTAGTGYALRWSSLSSTPANRRFDLQFKRLGTTTWVWYRHATATRTGRFNPTKAGTYVIRARTQNVGVGTSGWSPLRTVKIT